MITYAPPRRFSNPHTTSRLSGTVNAMILPSEDDPKGSNYNSPESSYQSLVVNGVYKSVDVLSISWVNAVLLPNADMLAVPDWTIVLGEHTHPGGISNLQYMQWIIRDARIANPDIKIVVMLYCGADELSQMFTGPTDEWEVIAQQFAKNVVNFLQTYDIDGFDMDWESSVTYSTTQEMFIVFFSALYDAFQAQSKPYYLMITPLSMGNMDAATANTVFDLLTLQNYGGADPSAFPGIDRNRMAYGAGFETQGGIPTDTAQSAYSNYTAQSYGAVSNWRLNSGDFIYEQAQQMILYQLVKGIPGPSFDDTPIVTTAGNPRISQLVIRSGDVLDALQVTNQGTIDNGTHSVDYVLPQHGGNSGTIVTVNIPDNDAVVEVSGFTGSWFGWECVTQIRMITQLGLVLGPYGTQAYVDSPTPFSYRAPSGKSIVALRGTTVNVPLAGGDTTDIIATLNVSYA